MENNVLPKWLVNALGGLLIALVALLVVQKAHDLNTAFNNQKPANTISVTGTGKVTATPDLATMMVGFQNQGSTAQEVKDKNNAAINKVISYVKSEGVADKDIQTSQLNLNPTQDWNNGTPKITGYSGDQTLTIIIHGVDKSQDLVNKIEDGVVNNGANQVNGVNLTIEKPDKLKQDAKDLAIDDAKAKAQELAQRAGLKLGKVVSISENGGGYPGPIPYAMDSAPTAAMGMAKSVAPDIQVGSQDITETMTVVFEVK